MSDFTINDDYSCNMISETASWRRWRKGGLYQGGVSFSVAPQPLGWAVQRDLPGSRPQQGGARIVGSRCQALPMDVFLLIHKDSKAFKARIIWRNADEAELAFESSVDLNAITDPALNYLNAVARANAATLSWR